MQYYNPENRDPRRWALVAAILYLALLIVLMLTIRFTVIINTPDDQGILVEFGDSDFGVGEQDLSATDVAATTPPPPSQQSEEIFEVDERQEVAIEQRESNSPEQRESQTPEQPKSDTTVVEERVVNKQALFPGRSEQNSAISQGSSEGVGNQGAESGGQSGASQGGGEGNQAMAVLKDRSVVGSLPKPTYAANVSGKVIVDITVDDYGNVKTASYRAQGSTTNNSQLTAAAIEAAKKARFTPSDNVIQGGTITYIFKMN